MTTESRFKRWKKPLTIAFFLVLTVAVAVLLLELAYPLIDPRIER